MGVTGWDDVAPESGGAWKSDDPAEGAWAPDSTAAAGNGFTTEFTGDNTSKHANGDFAGGAHDGGCRVCGDEGHFARDCPQKPEGGGGLTGECFNCGEVGHNRADCPNPAVERPFTGTCRFCEQEGHRAAECPEKPATVCMVCKEEGHIGRECTANRLLAGSDIVKMKAGDAWKMLEKADEEKDLDDIKQAVFNYAASFPALILPELESTFRSNKMNTHLIAKEQLISDTHTIVNFQGTKDQKYVVSFQFSAKPRRKKSEEGWPKTPEENLLRLQEAGFVLDGMVPKCINCGQLGHMSRTCPEDKIEKERKVITCANCNEEGHYARDCQQERKSGKSSRGCRNCGSEEHIAKECPEPPNPENVECKNCNQMGHFARDCPDREPELCRNCGEEGHRARDCDKERVIKCRNCDGEGHVSRECPEPRNMSKVQCRNCDEYGHTSRDCPQPTDWSRVECSNCHEKGHSYKRCTNPAAEADGGDGGGWEDGGAANNGGGGAGAAPAAASGGGW